MRTILITTGKFRNIDGGDNDVFSVKHTASFAELTTPLTNKFGRFILNNKLFGGKVIPTFYSTRLGVMFPESHNYPLTSPSHRMHKTKRSEVIKHQKYLASKRIYWEHHIDNLQVSGHVTKVVDSALAARGTKLVIAMPSTRYRFCRNQITTALSKCDIDHVIKHVRFIGNDVEHLFGKFYRICVPNVEPLNPCKLHDAVNYNDLYYNIIFYLYATLEMPPLTPEDEFDELISKRDIVFKSKEFKDLIEEFETSRCSADIVSIDTFRQWIESNMHRKYYGSVSRAIAALLNDNTTLGNTARAMNRNYLTELVRHAIEYK